MTQFRCWKWLKTNFFLANLPSLLFVTWKMNLYKDLGLIDYFFLVDFRLVLYTSIVRNCGKSLKKMKIFCYQISKIVNISKQLKKTTTILPDWIDDKFQLIFSLFLNGKLQSPRVYITLYLKSSRGINSVHI